MPSGADWTEFFWAEFVKRLDAAAKAFNSEGNSRQLEVRRVQTENVTAVKLRTEDGAFNLMVLFDQRLARVSVQHPTQKGAWPADQAKLPDLWYQLRREGDDVVARLEDNAWNAVPAPELADRIVSRFVAFLRGV